MPLEQPEWEESFATFRLLKPVTCFLYHLLITPNSSTNWGPSTETYKVILIHTVTYMKISKE